MSVFGPHNPNTSPLSARLSRRQMLKRGAVGLTATGVAAIVHPAYARSARAVPAQAPISAERFAQAIAVVESLVPEALARTGVPGLAIAVVDPNRQLFARGYGVRDSAGSDLIDADTVFRLASMSKALASTVSAGLVGDGRLSWDSRIADTYPEIEFYDPWVTHAVTVRDCLCHRTGLPEYAGDLLIDLQYDGPTILNRLRYVRPATSMRSQYAYNNITYSLGNITAARAAGLSWEDACVERLYKPLGMSRTSTRYADFLATPNRAIEHQRIDGRWVHTGEASVDAGAPAGNVSSSVNDLSRWVQLQLGMGSFEGRQLIPAEALGETHRPYVAINRAADPNLPPLFYGLGWEITYGADGQTVLSHSGAFNLGAATTVYLRPAMQLGFVGLSNAQPVGIVEALAVSFFDVIANGRLTQDWLTAYIEGFAAFVQQFIDNASPHDYSQPPAQPTPALAADAYTGSYSNDLYGPVNVVEQNGGLVLELGPRPTVYALTHYDHDVFTFMPTGENAFAVSGARFTIAADGRAASVLLDHLNTFGQGTFVRTEAAS